MDSVVVTRPDLSDHEVRLKQIASQTLEDFRCIVKDARDGLALLSLLKFNKIGRDPLKGTELNFIEQLNQTFTALASIKAANHIFQTHADSHTIRMNLGTNSGSDLEVLDARQQKIGIAEVFATVDPTNNDKLRNDVKKVRESSKLMNYPIRSVYFLSPHFPLSRSYKDSYNGKIRSFKFIRGEITLLDGLFVKVFNETQDMPN
jgi:hypothetical protein